MSVQRNTETRPLLSSSRHTYSSFSEISCFVCGTGGSCPVSFRCGHALCVACSDALSAKDPPALPCPLCIANRTITGHHLDDGDTEESLDVMLCGAVVGSCNDDEKGLKKKCAAGEEEPEGPPEEKPQEKYIEHKLSQNDTFAMLCLKYNTTVDAIRMHNNIMTPHLDLLPLGTTLRIPFDPTVSPADMRRSEDVKKDEATIRNKKIKSVMSLCKIAEVQEATYYLEIADWDLVTAVREWKSDTIWEAAHPMAKMRPFSCRCAFRFMAKKQSCRKCGDTFCAKCTATPCCASPVSREPPVHCNRCLE